MPFEDEKLCFHCYRELDEYEIEMEYTRCAERAKCEVREFRGSMKAIEYVSLSEHEARTLTWAGCRLETGPSRVYKGAGIIVTAFGPSLKAVLLKLLWVLAGRTTLPERMWGMVMRDSTRAKELADELEALRRLGSDRKTKQNFVKSWFYDHFKEEP